LIEVERIRGPTIEPAERSGAAACEDNPGIERRTKRPVHAVRSPDCQHVGCVTAGDEDDVLTEEIGLDVVDGPMEERQVRALGPVGGEARIQSHEGLGRVPHRGRNDRHARPGLSGEAQEILDNRVNALGSRAEAAKGDDVSSCHAEKSNVSLTPVQRTDGLTVAAVAVLAYVLANVVHEGLGHGGACLLLSGCDPVALSTAYFESETSQMTSAAGPRWLAAGGTLANAGAGALFLWARRRSAQRSGALRYFFWCAMSVNLLVAAGYPLFSGVLGVGDWVKVADGWPLARPLLAVSGLLLYVGAVYIALVELATLVGTGRPVAVGRGLQLTVFPYLAGSLASTLGAFLNPSGAVFVATSAAAHFGGTSGLAWMAQLLGASWLRPVRVEPVKVDRSWAWIAGAAAALCVHILILGRGLIF
jgi:hypothetical protein